MNEKIEVPERIKEQILLAGDYFEKARNAEAEVYQWMRQNGLIHDEHENRVEENFIECVCMGDGGGAQEFISYLESVLEEPNPEA